MGEEMNREGIAGKITGEAIAEIGKLLIDRCAECLDVALFL
jgi:hypothetical protein